MQSEVSNQSLSMLLTILTICCKAYFEYMPIRQVDMDDNLRIWRTFSIGSLFDLIMLDTRNYDRSITDLSWNTKYIHGKLKSCPRVSLITTNNSLTQTQKSPTTAADLSWAPTKKTGFTANYLAARPVVLHGESLATKSSSLASTSVPGSVAPSFPTTSTSGTDTWPTGTGKD